MMKLDIYLRFSTYPGQQLLIYGNIPELGNGDKNLAIGMDYFNSTHWHIQLTVIAPLNTIQHKLCYGFILKEKDNTTRYDWDKDRILDTTLFPDNVLIVDSWNEIGSTENLFSTDPFKKVFFHHSTQQTSPLSGDKRYRFSVRAFSLLPNEQLAMTGNNPKLGNWMSSGSIPLIFDGLNWNADLDEESIDPDTEYKYCVVDFNGKLIRYEEGKNRKIGIPLNESTVVWMQDGLVTFNHTLWKGAGLAIPVFSLRTKNSQGTGDFADLLKLVDWSQSVSLKMIQLLPVHDTTCTHTYADAYPYAAISAFALHPLYASIAAIAGRKHRSLILGHLKRGKQLNKATVLDYPAVMELKWDALNILYREMGDKTFLKKSFREFFLTNQHWLKSYAAYSFLREKYKTPDWSTWGKYADYTDVMIDELVKRGSRNYTKIRFYYFVQFCLHQQLSKAHQYANRKGIILKGDVAIGVHRLSADTWKNPSFFHLNMQAGAPPDDFAVKGQNWGFPTYHWENMRVDGYSWWKKRLQQMSFYMDAIRLDHVLGFFRIWTIPDAAREGIMGRFVPAIPISTQELLDRGIEFCEYRYTTPYITDEVLWEFAAQREHLIKPFLEYRSNRTYRFKTTFSTQQKIELYFKGIKKTEANVWLKQLLFDLQNNLLLWKDSNSDDAYHFRFNAIKTNSFSHLDAGTQVQVEQLYNQYYFQRQEVLWKNEALEKLGALKRFSRLLICGEDLGLLPSSVPEVMAEVGMLSMEVQRMPKQYGKTFSDPLLSPYLSVVTPSTHDMSTLRLWWLENRAVTQRFYNEMLWQEGDAPQEPDVHIIKMIVNHHLNSPAMWAVFQLQDLFALDENLRVSNPSTERINIPSDPMHYWQYRMHISIEDLLKKDTFNKDLTTLILSNGR